MNERIKQLAEQAYAVCGKHTNDYNGPTFTEKFAELIIQECMSNLYLHGYDDARAQIKEHFGV